MDPLTVLIIAVLALDVGFVLGAGWHAALSDRGEPPEPPAAAEPSHYWE